MLIQKFALRFGSDFIIRAITSITAIVIARVVGPAVFGTLSFGIAYVDVFGFFLGFFGLSHLKLVSEGKDLGNCIGTFSRLQVLMVGFAAGFIAVLIIVQKNLLGISFETGAHEIVIYIFFLHLLISQPVNIPLMTFAAKNEQAKYNITQLTKTVILNALRFSAALLGYKAITLASTRVAAVLLIAPVAWYFFKGYPKGRWDKILAKKYFTISAPLFVVVFIDNQVVNIGKVLLQFFTSSKEVGVYSANYGIISVILLLSGSAGSIFFPLFSEAVSRNNFKQIRTTVYKYERFIFIHLIPVLIFLSLYAEIIIRVLLGDKYTAAKDFLVILVGAAFFQSWLKPYGDIILGLGEYKLAAFLNVLRLVLFLVLSVFFMSPAFLNSGALGLSISLLLSTIFLSILYYYKSFKKCGINTLRENYKYIVHGILSFATWLFIYHSGFKLNLPLWIFLFPILFFFGHYTSLYMFKLFSGDDIEQLLSLLNIKSLLRYIKDEIHPGS